MNEASLTELIGLYAAKKIIDGRIAALESSMTNGKRRGRPPAAAVSDAATTPARVKRTRRKGPVSQAKLDALAKARAARQQNLQAEAGKKVKKGQRGAAKKKSARATA